MAGAFIIFINKGDVHGKYDIQGGLAIQCSLNLEYRILSPDLQNPPTIPSIGEFAFTLFCIPHVSFTSITANDSYTYDGMNHNRGTYLRHLTFTKYTNNCHTQSIIARYLCMFIFSLFSIIQLFYDIMIVEQLDKNTPQKPIK